MSSFYQPAEATMKLLFTIYHESVLGSFHWKQTAGKAKLFRVSADLIRDALAGSGSRNYGACGRRRSSLRRRHFNAAHPDHQSRSSGEGHSFLTYLLSFFYIMKFVILSQSQPIHSLDLTSIDIQLQSLTMKSSERNKAMNLIRHFTSKTHSTWNICSLRLDPSSDTPHFSASSGSNSYKLVI